MTVFPLTDWSYYLLAMLMPTIALWIVWRLSADYLEIEKRVAGVILLMLMPFYNFHALTFNVNTVPLPTWAATTFSFLRSYKTRDMLNGALAGTARPPVCWENTGRFPARRIDCRCANRFPSLDLFPLHCVMDRGRRRLGGTWPALGLALPA